MSTNDLLPLLQERLRGLYSPVLDRAHATIALTAGGLATWHVRIDDGRTVAAPGAPAEATTTIRAPMAVLTDVVSGRRSGIEAFLAGDLTVRGNLALAVQLDGLFPGVRADSTRSATRVARVAEVDTFYLEAGRQDALPVVLVHGLGATNASMLPLYAELARDFHVFAPDLPGHGGSQPTTRRHDAEFLGSWLDEFLLATCDRPAVLVGNSLGGRTALQAALDHPELVAGCVLLCPAVAFRKLRQFVPLVRVVRDELAVLPLYLPRQVPMRAVHALFADDTRLPQAWYDASIDEFLRTLGIRANRMCVFSALRNIYLDKPFGEGGFWDRLPTLQPPALFLWGDQDPLVPAGFSRFVADALPSARSIVLESCGHIPQFEHPELTAQLTRDFLAGIEWNVDKRA